MSDTIRESNGHFATGNPGGPGRPRKVVSRSGRCRYRIVFNCAEF